MSYGQDYDHPGLASLESWKEFDAKHHTWHDLQIQITEETNLRCRQADNRTEHNVNQVLFWLSCWKLMDNDEPALSGPRLVRDNDELWWDYSLYRQWRPFCDCAMMEWLM